MDGLGISMMSNHHTRETACCDWCQKEGKNHSCKDNSNGSSSVSEVAITAPVQTHTIPIVALPSESSNDETSFWEACLNCCRK